MSGKTSKRRRLSNSPDTFARPIPPLPSHFLASVCSHLNSLRDRVNMSRVCRHWQQSTAKWHDIRRVRVVNCCPTPGPRIYHEIKDTACDLRIFTRIYTHFVRVRDLVWTCDIVNDDRETIDELKQIIAFLAHTVTRFEINYACAMPDDIRSLFLSMSQMTHVTMRNWWHLHDWEYLGTTQSMSLLLGDEEMREELRTMRRYISDLSAPLLHTLQLVCFDLPMASDLFLHLPAHSTQLHEVRSLTLFFTRQLYDGFAFSPGTIHFNKLSFHHLPKLERFELNPIHYTRFPRVKRYNSPTWFDFGNLHFVVQFIANALPSTVTTVIFTGVTLSNVSRERLAADDFPDQLRLIVRDVLDERERPVHLQLVLRMYSGWSTVGDKLDVVVNDKLRITIRCSLR